MIKDLVTEFFGEESADILACFDWEKVDWFVRFLKDFNEIGGFFSKRDSDQIEKRHILDCLYYVYRIYKYLPVSRETSLIDIGTGPGLPGFLFHCLNEVPTVCLLDSQKRKLSILEREFKPRHKLYFVYERAEEFQRKYDLVVTRASISYPFSAEVFSTLLVQNGFYVPFFGQLDVEADLESEVLKRYHYEVVDSILLKKLDFLGMRHIKFLKKKRVTHFNDRRSWKLILKDIKKYGKGNLDQ